MESLIQTYLPNVYKMGWAGQAGWGTAIYLTLYMTVLSFIIGGFLGLVAGLFLVLTAPGGVLENKVIFWILDKITSIFRAVPFIILLAIMSPLSHLIVKTSIGPNAALVPLSFAVFAFFARQVQVVLAELDGGVIEAAQASGDRDEAEHAPVLNARALVDQIVPRSAQRQHQTAAPALREVVAQRVELFPGQVGMLAQLREEVIDRVVAVVAAVEHDAPVRIDNIAVSRAAEGGIVERVQHRVVIVGDGDRVVGEAAVGSLRLRAGEHEHLRLSGQRRVQHDVLAIGKRPVQVDL